ncbi:hypothetical protein HK102_002576 [Quaeritorhiza haematococci]|nr:hypothetical protein HK102_002576 [Quaeritorhiza haematococci]
MWSRAFILSLSLALGSVSASSQDISSVTDGEHLTSRELKEGLQPRQLGYQSSVVMIPHAEDASATPQSSGSSGMEEFGSVLLRPPIVRDGAAIRTDGNEAPMGMERLWSSGYPTPEVFTLRYEKNKSAPAAEGKDKEKLMNGAYLQNGFGAWSLWSTKHAENGVMSLLHVLPLRESEGTGADDLSSGGAMVVGTINSDVHLVSGGEGGGMELEAPPNYQSLFVSRVTKDGNVTWTKLITVVSTLSDEGHTTTKLRRADKNPHANHKSKGSDADSHTSMGHGAGFIHELGVHFSKMPVTCGAILVDDENTHSSSTSGNDGSSLKQAEKGQSIVVVGSFFGKLAVDGVEISKSPKNKFGSFMMKLSVVDGQVLHISDNILPLQDLSSDKEGSIQASVVTHVHHDPCNNAYVVSSYQYGFSVDHSAGGEPEISIVTDVEGQVTSLDADSVHEASTKLPSSSTPKEGHSRRHTEKFQGEVFLRSSLGRLDASLLFNDPVELQQQTLVDGKPDERPMPAVLAQTDIFRVNVKVDGHKKKKRHKAGEEEEATKNCPYILTGVYDGQAVQELGLRKRDSFSLSFAKRHGSAPMLLGFVAVMSSSGPSGGLLWSHSLPFSHVKPPKHDESPHLTRGPTARPLHNAHTINVELGSLPTNLQKKVSNHVAESTHAMGVQDVVFVAASLEMDDVPQEFDNLLQGIDWTVSNAYLLALRLTDGEVIYSQAVPVPQIPPTISHQFSDPEAQLITSLGIAHIPSDPTKLYVTGSSIILVDRHATTESDARHKGKVEHKMVSLQMGWLGVLDLFAESDMVTKSTLAVGTGLVTTLMDAPGTAMEKEKEKEKEKTATGQAEKLESGESGGSKDSDDKHNNTGPSDGSSNDLDPEIDDWVSLTDMMAKNALAVTASITILAALVLGIYYIKTKKVVISVSIPLQSTHSTYEDEDSVSPAAPGGHLSSAPSSSGNSILGRIKGLLFGSAAAVGAGGLANYSSVREDEEVGLMSDDSTSVSSGGGVAGAARRNNGGNSNGSRRNSSSGAAGAAAGGQQGGGAGKSTIFSVADDEEDEGDWGWS